MALSKSVNNIPSIPPYSISEYNINNQNAYEPVHQRSITQILNYPFIKEISQLPNEVGNTRSQREDLTKAYIYEIN